MTHRTACCFGWLTSGRPTLVLALLVAGLGVAGCHRRSETWMLSDVSGHLPDLRFTLATAGKPHFTATDLRGHVVLLYFGYLHCPDECPLTMSRMGRIVQTLGSDADKVRILFVSVDPKRDTPELVRDYARAYSAFAIGAVGTPDEIETLAKRYRVAYQINPPGKDGNYEVMHGKGVYVFDSAGHARFLISDNDSPAAVAHDLHQLAASS